jgi:hypothetical protein
MSSAPGGSVCLFAAEKLSGTDLPSMCRLGWPAEIVCGYSMPKERKGKMGKDEQD